VILRPDHWWGAMLAFLAGIPERVGYRMPDVEPFLTDVIGHNHEHVVVQNLRLIERWTGALEPQDCRYDFPLDSLDTAYVDGYLQEWGIAQNQPVLCIHPGSGTWVKRWQEDRWAIVADTLSEQLNASVVFTGGDHESNLVKSITAQMSQPACIMVGDTQVGQLAALYRRSCVVLGPDSGPLHLAAAVGTPTVTLFGPADPVEFGPWGTRDHHIALTSDIDCRPCRVLDWGSEKQEQHPCVFDITLGQVLEAARSVAQHPEQ
jgi:ADP-heptose:LPS heptosyltransferase